MRTLTEQKFQWTKPVMQVYKLYPASFRSEAWPDIVRAANSGDVAKAKELAREHERTHRTVRAENVIARRIRLQRAALFAMVLQTRKAVKALYANIASELEAKLLRSTISMARLPAFKTAVRMESVLLRRELTKLLTSQIWEAIILGVKNMGEAIKPILRDNQESFREELSDVALLEERLSLSMDAGFASRAKGHVKLGSDKWSAILDRLYTNATKKALGGLTLSDRIWDLTDRMEKDLIRKISMGVGTGQSAQEMARDLKKYVSDPDQTDTGTPGPGFYYSPLKNALRLARTEINRAYTQATAAWAENKPWVTGIQPTLSPAHDKEDDCDDLAAGPPLSPEEFATAIPAHPHCACTGTYVIDETYLDQAAPNEDTQEED